MQCIPRRESRTGQRRRFKEIEVARHVDEAMLIESAILSQGAIDTASKSRRKNLRSQRACQMALTKESNHFVARFEPHNGTSNSFDRPCAVAAINNDILLRKCIYSQDDSEITEVEGGRMDCVELASYFWDRAIVEVNGRQTVD